LKLDEETMLKELGDIENGSNIVEMVLTDLLKDKKIDKC